MAYDAAAFCTELWRMMLWRMVVPAECSGRQLRREPVLYEGTPPTLYPYAIPVSVLYEGSTPPLYPYRTLRSTCVAAYTRSVQDIAQRTH
eukprot:3087618-Rhodomonas_salina.3